MRINFLKTATENILELVTKSNPNFLGTPADIEVQYVVGTTEEHGVNTQCTLTANDQGIYPAGDTHVVYYDRRSVEEYVEVTGELSLPEGTLQENMADLLGEILFTDVNVRTAMSLSVEFDMGGGTGILTVIPSEEYQACLNGEYTTAFVVGDGQPVYLSDHIEIYELDGFDIPVI